jgi:interleukin-like EMT inducer protein
MWLVGLFFLAATTLYTWPLVTDLRTRLLLGMGDYAGESALIAWNAYAVVRQPLHLFDTKFYYPYSNTIAYGQSLFFPGLLAVPLYWLTAEPLLSSNILLFGGLVVSGAGMYLLAYTLTRRVGPSLLAGVAFAYFPNRMEHLGQFTVQTAWLMPLCVWALYRFLFERRWGHLLVLVVGLWAQVLSSMYLAYALGFLLAGLLLACLLLRPRLLDWTLLARGAVGLGLLIGLLAPFLRPYLALHQAGLERDVLQAEYFGMDLLSILDPGVYNWLYGKRLFYLARSEGGLFPGLVVLGLAGLAVGWALRERDPEAPPPPAWVRPVGWGLAALLALCLIAIVVIPWTGRIDWHVGRRHLLRAHDLTLPVLLLPILALGAVALVGRRRSQAPPTPREWIAVFLFLSVLTYELTLTPTLRIANGPGLGNSLFRYVFFYAPGGSAFRAPGRWCLVFVIPLALLAAFGASLALSWLRESRRQAAAVVLVGLVMVEHLDRQPWDWLPATPPVYRWLAQEPGDFAILELPVYAGLPDALYMYWQTGHWKRLVAGAVGFVPATIDEIVDASDPFDLPALVTVMRSIYPLRYVLAHRQLMKPPQRDHWERVRAAPPAALRFERTVGTTDVYALMTTPETDVELNRYFSTDFVRAHPVAELEVRIPEDAEARQWVEVAFNGRPPVRVAMGGPVVLRLEPPYRIAGRNWLHLVHRYELLPGTSTGRAAYRVGRTGTEVNADIAVRSGGKEHGNVASIRVNRLEVSRNRRGYNVVALEAATGRVMATELFDTFHSDAEAHRMATFIAALAPGTVVVAAVKDDGGGQLTEHAVAALRSLGGRVDLRRTLFVSHLLVGVKGAPPGTALEQTGMRPLSASVGVTRPLALTLQSFSLR